MPPLTLRAGAIDRPIHFDRDRATADAPDNTEDYGHYDPNEDVIGGEHPEPPSLAPSPTSVKLPAPIDPTKFKPNAPWPTRFATENLASGVAAPTVRDYEKKLLSADQIAANINATSQWGVIKQVAAISIKLPYIDSGLSNARTSIDDGLSAGGGQCDFNASSSAYFMVHAKNGLKQDDVWVGQGYLSGGLHNVVFFRNPLTGKWDVLDYQNHVSVNADTRDAAMQAYFGGAGKFIMYQATDPKQKSSPLMLVKSFHGAAVDELFAQPGNGTLRGNYGSAKSLWEAGFVVPNLEQNELSISNFGARARTSGVDAAVMIDPSTGFDRLGISSLASNKAHELQGAKMVVLRDPSGSGTDIFMGGEWWHVDDKRYVGFVGAVELRVNVTSQRFSNQTTGGAVGETASNSPGVTMTSLAPILAAQAGRRIDIVGNDGSPFAITAELAARLRLGVPFDLSPEARSITEKNTGNNTPFGGAIDPGGIFEYTDAGGNGAIVVTWRPGPGWSLSGTARAKTEVIDPTFMGGQPSAIMPVPFLPLVMGAQGEAKLSYRDARVGFQLGALGGSVIYARDVQFGVHNETKLIISKALSAVVQAAVGVYKNGELFANGALSLAYQASAKVQITAGGGILEQGLPGAVKRAPQANLSIVWAP